MKKHDCLLFGGGRNPVELRLENGDVSVQLTLFARMIVSDMAILQAVATASLGIAILPAIRSIQELSVDQKLAPRPGAADTVEGGTPLGGG